MLKKFRRGSKAKADTVQRSDSVATSVPPTEAKQRVTFFDLPGEIRNDIYTLIATSISLRLFPPSINSSSKSNKTYPPIPSLLLVSKRVRNEYLPLLLSTAPVTANVINFDFRSLNRVISSLYPSELKALRRNPSLRIELHLTKCSANVVPDLRKWCSRRADSLDCLAWEYVLSEQGNAADGRLAWFAGTLRVVYERLEGKGEQWEVGKILDVIVKKLKGAGRARDGQWVSGYGDDFAFVIASRQKSR